MYANYGYKSNEELIHGYGFMLEENPADFFQLSIGMKAQTEDGMSTSVTLPSMHPPLCTGVGSLCFKHAAWLPEGQACVTTLEEYDILSANLEGLVCGKMPRVVALSEAGHCPGSE